MSSGDPRCLARVLPRLDRRLEAPDRALEIGESGRLPEEVVHARPEAELPDSWVLLPGEGDDPGFGRRAVLPDLPRRRDPVEPGEIEVHEDEVVALAGDGFHRGGAVFRLMDCQAERREDAGRHPPDGDAVVHYEGSKGR